MIGSNHHIQQSEDVFTDISSLQVIRELKDKNTALEKVAEQFESMMLRMMMKSMRSANDVFAEGNYLNSHEGNVYRDMLDDQLSLNLVKGRGMGIAEVMVKQLRGRFGEAEPVNAAQQKASAETLSRSSVTAKKAQSPASAEAIASRFYPPRFDGSAEQFVESLYPLAEKAAGQLGVSPDVLLAQAALETGWGAKVSSYSSGRSSFNLFNIKANQQWAGRSVTVPTMEIREGVAVRELAAFRAYNSVEDSFKDYVALISESGRYQPALQSGSDEEYIKALARGGYATDTQYAEKVIRILRSESLQSAIKTSAEKFSSLEEPNSRDKMAESAILATMAKTGS